MIPLILLLSFFLTTASCFASFNAPSSFQKGFFKTGADIPDRSTLFGLWQCDAPNNTVTGGVVDQATDQSGQGNHLTATTTARPSLVTSGAIGSKCSFSFDGTNNYLAKTGGFPTSADYSIYVVFRADTFATSAHNLLSGSANHASYFAAGNAAPKIYHGTGDIITSNTTVTTGTDHVIVFTWDQDTSDGYLYLDGDLVGSNLNAAANANANIQLGAFNAASKWDGYIAEAGGWSKTLSQGEIDQLFAYSARKYSTTAAIQHFIAMGDSITAIGGGYVANDDIWIKQVVDAQHPLSTKYSNIAVVGDNCIEQDSDASTTVDNFFLKSRAKVFIMCGINDIADGFTVSQTFDRIKTVIQNRASAGYSQIYFLTPTRFDNGTDRTSAMESLYAEITSRLSELTAVGLTALVDVFNLTGLTSTTDTCMKPDKIHWKECAHDGATQQALMAL